MVDDELLGVELIPLSSKPLLGLLDTTFTVVVVDVDGLVIDTLISVASDLVILLLPFEVG